jgi:hypothetical protein
MNMGGEKTIDWKTHQKELRGRKIKKKDKRRRRKNCRG